MANLTFNAGGRQRELTRRKMSGPFHVRFEYKGKAYLRSLGTIDPAVAKVKGKKIIEDTMNGGVVTGDITFDALIERFSGSRVSKGLGTLANDRCFAATLRSTFQRAMTTPARQIVTGDILTWLNNQAKARNWRNRTYNHYRLWLWQIFHLAAADRLIAPDENPFQSKMIRRRRPETVMRNIPSAEQFAQIIQKVRSVDGDDAADFLEFLGCAGVGQAEAAALQWCDIGASKIRFVRRKTGIAFQVPIYAWLAATLSRIRVKAAGASPNSLVFKVNDAGKALRRACDALGLTRFTQRGLRAMLIKKLYDASVPVKRIALWQGHRDGGKLIQEIYTEVFCETDAAAEQADLALVGGSGDLTLPANLCVVSSAG